MQMQPLFGGYYLLHIVQDQWDTSLSKLSRIPSPRTRFFIERIIPSRAWF